MPSLYRAVVTCTDQKPPACGPTDKDVNSTAIVVYLITYSIYTTTSTGFWFCDKAARPPARRPPHTYTFHTK